MTYSTSSGLPPPAVFLHQETLHAIPLPPLASWLISLRKPEHLVRLNDLLQRYKTPQSYHRVDVRLIESSELPPGSPDSQVEELGEDRKVRKGSRDIVELDEGNTLEGYWWSRNGQGHQPAEPVDHDQRMTVEGNESRMDKIDDAAGSGSRQNITSQPHTETLKEQERSDTKMDTTTPSLTQQTEEALKALRLPPSPSEPPQSPIPTYPLPPIGPTRKVRELRLDLRTLDAAALFALETWRREELGLEKLNMEFPDSVWYKDPTPTPSPSPPPKSIYTSTGKKRGRPRKHHTPIIVNPEDEMTETGLGLQFGETDGEAQNGMMTEEQKTKGYDHLVNTPQTNQEKDGNIGLQGEETQSAINVPDILETFVELAQKGEEVEKVDVSPPDLDDDDPVRSLEDDPVNPEAKTGGEMDLAQRQVQNEEEEAEVGPSRATPSSPSPDILLNDIFNEKEDDDPDFVPPPSPPARRPRPRRNRKSQVDENAEEGEKGRVDFDMGVVETHQHERRTKSPQFIVDKTSKSRLTSKSKSVSVEVIMLPEIPTTETLDHAKEQAIRSPSIELLPNQPELQKSAKRPRGSTTMSASIALRSPKRARIFTDSPTMMISKTSPVAKRRAGFVVEIPSRRAVPPDSEDDVDDDEEEEWGFLRSFG
ncbi:hypothetical protein L486_00049 [Kwoniella mangroviensis CBS 10435]|uniref:Uncharacterized protein n=1 Tax=Kwoniella mangroviensis CBS 10435 TaxID=1331196 RepID=A0A1B9IY08_9TREE|nr:hypothetical protein L486_00049 [Kwoniella mangroviensis CBS 10435]